MAGFSPLGSRSVGSVPYGISPGPSRAAIPCGRPEWTASLNLRPPLPDNTRYCTRKTRFVQGYTPTPGKAFGLANRRGRYTELLPLPTLDPANVKRHTNFRAPHGLFASKLNEYTIIEPTVLNASKMLEYVIVKPKYIFHPRRRWDPVPRDVPHPRRFSSLRAPYFFRKEHQRHYVARTAQPSQLPTPRRYGVYTILDDGTITIIWS